MTTIRPRIGANRAITRPLETWLLIGSIPIALALALAAFGYYVLAYIATGKA